MELTHCPRSLHDISCFLEHAVVSVSVVSRVRDSQRFSTGLYWIKRASKVRWGKNKVLWLDYAVKMNATKAKITLEESVFVLGLVSTLLLGGVILVIGYIVSRLSRSSRSSDSTKSKHCRRINFIIWNTSYMVTGQKSRLRAREPLTPSNMILFSFRTFHLQIVIIVPWYAAKR